MQSLQAGRDASHNGMKSTAGEIGDPRHDGIHYVSLSMAKTSTTYVSNAYEQFCLDLGQSQEGYNNG